MWKVKNETSKLPPQFKMKTLTASGNCCIDVFSTLNIYYKETHTELPNGTQSIPQKQNKQNKNQPDITRIFIIWDHYTRAASYSARALKPSHLSRVSLSEFSIFSSAVRCNIGNVIDELLPKFVFSVRKSLRELMSYYSAKWFH